MKYVLLLGVKHDPVLHYFFQQPRVRKDKRFLFLNEERIGQDIFLSDQGWELPCGSFLPHHSIQAVYNRLYAKAHDHVALSYLQWLLDEVYPRVLNRPKNTLTNFSKSWQLLQAKAAGLMVPNTTVEANVSRVKRMSNQSKSRVFKSASSVRSIVESVECNHQNQVHEPVLFQEDMGRVNIRVHMMTGATFAQEIRSREVDYRYDMHATRARTYQLPPGLIKKLESLAIQFGLVLSGSDFMLYEGEYYFLEMNPSPGYAYYEKQMVGRPLSEKIYEYLVA